MRAALAAGQTNYPPSDGVLGLREAVARSTRSTSGLSYPVESVLITGGARPLLYGSYRTVLDPGDTVGLPGAVVEQQPLRIPERRARGRDPGARRRELLPDRRRSATAPAVARLMLINSPLNPTGTAIDPDVLRQSARLIVEENRRRERAGRQGRLALLRPGLLAAVLAPASAT